jgi:HlyD family secretion protein
MCKLSHWRRLCVSLDAEGSRSGDRYPTDRLGNSEPNLCERGPIRRQGRSTLHNSNGSGESEPDRCGVVVAAPGAGVVTQFGVAVGQVVKTTNPGSATKAVSIADLSSVWLIAEIDENNARPLRSGQPIEVRPTALAGRVYKGTLSTVSPIDPGTKRATARIVVESTDGALKLGMLAQFNLSTPSASGTLVVPEGAVLFENDSAGVLWRTTKKAFAMPLARR